MNIAIDFDGTCVSHDYPRIGKEIGAVPVLKKLIAAGHQLILFTMRGDPQYKYDGVHGNAEPYNYLTAAVLWFEFHEIPLWAVNTNPMQHHWTNSPKAFADLYIDDAALGCPLVEFEFDPPYADWHAIELMLIAKGILPSGD